MTRPTPTDDVVKRLRLFAGLYDTQRGLPWIGKVTPQAAFAEAADLIQYQAEEIERRDAALREIANHDSGVSDNHMECGECRDAYLGPYCDVKDIARTTLAGDKDD